MTYFFDRTWGRYTPLALLLLDFDIEIHDTHFGEATEDDVWIPEVSRRGWVILSENDPHANKREWEMWQRMITQHDARAFIFGTASVKKHLKFRAVVDAWDEMERIVATRAAPFAYRVTRSGDVRAIDL